MATAPSERVYPCRYCPEVFPGGFGAARRGTHEKNEHPDEWAAAKAEGPPPRSRSRSSRGDEEEGEGSERSEESATAPPSSTPYDLAPETPPTPARAPGLRSRIRGWGRGRSNRGQTAAPARSSERAPRRLPRGRRVPLDGDIADLYGMVGRRLERTAHYPTGRMLQFTSLAAGTIIDEAVAGTLPDRVLFQPLARGRTKWEPVLVLVGLPVVTARITSVLNAMEQARADGELETMQALGAQLAMLTEAFDFLAEQGLPLLAPGVERARAKAEAKREAMAQAFPELGVSDQVSAAEALRSMLFAPPGGMPPPATANEEARHDGNGRAEAFSSAFGAGEPGTVAQ